MFFFFNDTATTEIYTLSLHDALPILGTAGFDRDDDHWPRQWAEAYVDFAVGEKRQWLHDQGVRFFPIVGWAEDRKSTRLNSSHANISYAVFCLKKKKTQ